VDGRDLTTDAPEPVIVGDTVQLSSIGTCVRAWPATYAWSVTPSDGTDTTALPALDASSLSIYPLSAATYTIALTVTDALGRTATLGPLQAIDARGFALLDALPGSGDVRDASLGGGALWLATADGPFSMGLATPNVFDDLSAWAGLPVTDLSHVWYDDAV